MSGLASLDIECQDWDRFTVGALRYPDGTHAVCWSEDELLDKVTDYAGDIWTWAGGRYDSVWLARRAGKNGIRATGRLGGGGLVSLKLGKATVRDGYRLFPTSLAKASRLAGMKKATTQLPCVCGEDCPGFCSIKQRGMSAKHRRLLAEYLVHDTDCTSGVVETIETRFAEWGLVFKNTIGSSAWATMRDLFGVPEAVWASWRDYEAAHRGYHGGRTEMYRRFADVIWRYDRHAAYPASLAETAVPIGPYKRLPSAAAKRAFDHGKPGIYAATVTVPVSHVPPLPTRADGRLLYCTGSFDGSWPLPELQAAVGLGVTVDYFDEAIVWDEAERICAPYMRHVWALRDGYLAKDPESPEAGLLKFAANAPTGKLGQKPESECLEINPDPDEIVSCEGSGLCFGGALHSTMQECCEHECRERCKEWEPLDIGSGDPIVWSRPVWQLDDCSNVQMAAYLTATNRIEVGAQWRHAGAAHCYGDTDGCYASERLTRHLGDGLGEWGLEGVGLDFVARGPKAYRYAELSKKLTAKDVERLERQGLAHAELGAHVLSGEYNVRSKGVPLDDALVWDRWAGAWDQRLEAGERLVRPPRLANEGTPVPLDGGVWGVKGGARRGEIFVKRVMSRAAKNSLLYAGSRKVLPDGTTRPLDYDEYVGLVEAGEI